MIYIVLLPHNKKALLQDALVDKVKNLLYQSADSSRLKIEDFKIESESVHLLMRLEPTISIENMVKSLKKGSSKILQEELSAELAEYFRYSSFWKKGYFAATVGEIDKQRLKDYVCSVDCSF